VSDQAPVWSPPAGLPANLAEVPDTIRVTCPRCASVLDAAYYGPCQSCRDELRAAFAREARDVVVAAYEPKMNVTPNAVATKD
jgi:hypothetical protein